MTKPFIDRLAVTQVVEDGHKLPLTTEECDEAIRQMIDLRFSVPKMAERLGITRDAVTKRLKNLGRKANPRAEPLGWTWSYQDNRPKRDRSRKKGKS